MTAEGAALLDPGRLAGLLALQDLDRAGVVELVGTFLTEARSRLDALTAAHGRADGEAMAALAHSLKGSCGNFAAHTMAGMCTDLEAALASGAPVASLIEQLDREFGQVAPALREVFALDAA